MPPIDIAFISTAAEMDRALAVRRAVFIEEQGVPEDIEIDEHDRPEAWGRTSVHALLTEDGEALATGRLLLERHGEEFPHIGRVAVLAQHRGRGLGRELMRALEGRAQALGFAGITLAAQLHAVGFYEKLGYVARGEVFLDAGIEHRWMDRRLV